MMFILLLLGFIVIVGAFLPLIAKPTTKGSFAIRTFGKSSGSTTGREASSIAANRILMGFGILIFVVIVITIVLNWGKIIGNLNYGLNIVWLFILMVTGMFSKVFIENYDKDKRRFKQIKAAELIFPLLFSIFIFYPIWSIYSSTEISFFVFYSAYINGYFWENIVLDVHKKMLS